MMGEEVISCSVTVVVSSTMMAAAGFDKLCWLSQLLIDQAARFVLFSRFFLLSQIEVARGVRSMTMQPGDCTISATYS